MLRRGPSAVRDVAGHQLTHFEQRAPGWIRIRPHDVVGGFRRERFHRVVFVQRLEAIRDELFLEVAGRIRVPDRDGVGADTS